MAYGVIVKLKLNHDAIKRKIGAAIANSTSVKRIAYKKAYSIFYAAKTRMIAEFDRHPITQELESGPTAANISGTLEGYGNLFSFIGFEAGSDPIGPLRELLQTISFEQTVFRQNKWYFRVRLPEQEAIEGATPMPWEVGNSWALAIEHYISGLGHYMYTRWEGSRSGMGIQLPYENWGENIAFVGKPYITEILRHFRERINREV